MKNREIVVSDWAKCPFNDDESGDCLCAPILYDRYPHCSPHWNERYGDGFPSDCPLRSGSITVKMEG